MRRLCHSPVLPCLGLTLGLVLLAASDANADLSVNNIGLYGGGGTPIDPNSTIVEIQYTGNTGSWIYGDAQTAANWTYPGGSSIPLYCIDLAHDNYLASSYQLTTWTNPNLFSSDAINRVAWAAENASLSGYGPAATQLLIWSLIDPNFKVINWNGDSSLQSAYNAEASAMNSHYNPNINYLPQVQFFDAVHQPASNLNQDLVVGIPDPPSAPEPSTLVIASLGALGLIGYGWHRRRAGRALLRGGVLPTPSATSPQVAQHA